MTLIRWTLADAELITSAIESVHWSSDDYEALCRIRAFIEREAASATPTPRTTTPDEVCGFPPMLSRFAPCTRAKGHTGPCAHPEIAWPDFVARLREDLATALVEASPDEQHSLIQGCIESLDELAPAASPSVTPGEPDWDGLIDELEGAAFDRGEECTAQTHAATQAARTALRTSIARLTEQRDALQGTTNSMNVTITRLNFEVAALTERAEAAEARAAYWHSQTQIVGAEALENAATVERLQRDAERLDWLVNHPLRSHYNDAWRKWDGRESFRNAIDRARTPSTDTPQEKK